MVSHYQVYGQGLPVVFLHGFCEDSRIWDHWQKRFPRCQFVRIDLPGFGKTPLEESCSIEEMAAAVCQVLDQAGIQRCILIGHSMGGYVSLAFAANYPDRLIGLGLFHTHPYADTEETKTARLTRKRFVEKNGSAPYIRQVIPSLFAPDAVEANRSTIDLLIQRAEEYPDSGIINALQAMHDRPDRSAILAQLTVPVLFIVGKKDQAVPLDFSLGQLRLPEIASIHLDDQLGHMGMFEDPDNCLRVIKEFINLCRLYL